MGAMHEIETGNGIYQIFFFSGGGLYMGWGSQNYKYARYAATPLLKEKQNRFCSSLGIKQGCEITSYKHRILRITGF